MSPADPGQPRKRRPRCNFHFKIDETLTGEHREQYLALLRDRRTRIDDAHAWLLAHGYPLSRSAVTRHRRHLLGVDAERELELHRTAQLARMTTGPDAPDFIAGAQLRLQQIVFDRLVDLQTPTDEDRAEGRVSAGGTRVIPPAELLAFAKLVAQCVELERLYLKRLAAQDRRAAASDDAAAQSPAPRTDDELLQRMQDIMKRKI